MAAIIVDLACSSLALSPEDIIQRIPPQIKKMMDTIIDIIKITAIILPNKLGFWSGPILQRFLKSLGQGSSLAAKAGNTRGRRRVEYMGKRSLIKFFIVDLA